MASSFLLFVLLCSFAVVGHGHESFVSVSTSSFEPQDVCSPSTVTPAPNRAVAPLMHRHGPCAPSPSTDKPSPTEALRRSRARANYIMSRASRRTRTSTQDDGIPAYLGGFVDSLEYVVTLGLGTPAVKQVFLMDTGSDLTWVQCAPCNSSECYPQKDALFDPSKSSTYAPIPCGSDACNILIKDGYNNSCTNNNNTFCGYAIGYGDGSSTTGVYSTEALALAPDLVVNGFRFGCGHHQGGLNDRYDGLLDLGGAPESLPAQTSDVYGGAFSYCLPPANGRTGFLALGPPANTSGFLFVPMSRNEHERTFYGVTLAGSSVAGKQLDIPPKVFSGGMIIDSGTVLSFIPTAAHDALHSAFRAAMRPLVPIPGHGTCYNFTGHSNVTVPSVALTFGNGVTIDLDVPNGVLLDGCLAFHELGAGGGGVIGNVNQRAFEVLYDTVHSRVGFRAAAC